MKEEERSDLYGKITFTVARMPREGEGERERAEIGIEKEIPVH